jgi:lysophospholipase L1-like esterase
MDIIARAMAKKNSSDLTDMAKQSDLLTQKSRIDSLLSTPTNSFYQKSVSGITGALLVVSSGAITGQINLASVTPVATGYTPVSGDYVLLVYGVASGSAELIDARTGANGKTYTTAGQAVRTQLNLLASFNTSFYTLTAGNIIGANGVMGTYAPISASNLFTLTCGETIVITTSYNNPSNCSVLYKYNSDGTPLSKIFSANGSGTYIYTVTTPIEYLMFCGTTSDLQVYKFFGGLNTLNYIFSDYTPKATTTAISSKIDKVLDDKGIKPSVINEINTSYLNKNVQLYGKTGVEPTTLTDSYYNGTSIGFVAPKYLNKIRVKIKANTTESKTIRAVLTTKSNAEWTTIINANGYQCTKPIFEQYMADKIVDSQYTGNGTEQMVEFNFDNHFTNNQVARIIIYFIDSSIKIYHCNVNISGNFDYDKYNQYISYLPNNLFASAYATNGTSAITNASNAYSYSLYAEVYEYKFDQSNIFDKANKNDYLKAIFDKVLCIGDSITYGGAGKPGANVSISYPRYLSKLSGWTVDSNGMSGYSVTDIWNAIYAANTDYTQYDSVILFMGTNVVKYGTTTNDALTDTIATDANAVSYLDYANTATGNYCKIIKHILSKNSNIKIFLCGLTYQPRAEALNGIIKKIAENYASNNVKYLDLYNNVYYDLRQYIYHQYYNDTAQIVHFGKMGYLTLAKVIYNTMIDTIANDMFSYELPYKTS